MSFRNSWRGDGLTWLACSLIWAILGVVTQDIRAAWVALGCLALAGWYALQMENSDGD